MNLLRLSGAISLLLLAIIWDSSRAEAEPNWMRFGEAHFPSQIEKMEWSDGTPPMTAGSGVCWGGGNWCVNFSSSGAVAEKGPSGSGGTRFININIKGLTCLNPVVGSKPCLLHLYGDTQPVRKCVFYVKNPPEKDLSFRITCPQTLHLKRN